MCVGIHCCIHICTCIYLCINMYEDVNTSIHIYTSMNMCLHICYMYIDIYIYTHIYIYTYMHICMYTHMYIYMCVCAFCRIFDVIKRDRLQLVGVLSHVVRHCELVVVNVRAGDWEQHVEGVEIIAGRHSRWGGCSIRCSGNINRCVGVVIFLDFAWSSILLLGVYIYIYEYG